MRRTRATEQDRALAGVALSKANEKKVEIERLLADRNLRARVEAEAARDIYYATAPGDMYAVIDVDHEAQLRVIGRMQAQAEQVLRRRARQALAEAAREAAREVVVIDGERVPVLGGNETLTILDGYIGLRVSDEGGFLAVGSENRRVQEVVRGAYPFVAFTRAIHDGKKWRPNSLHTTTPVIPADEVRKVLSKAEREAVDALPEGQRTRAVLSLGAWHLVRTLQPVAAEAAARTQQRHEEARFERERPAREAEAARVAQEASRRKDLVYPLASPAGR
jgi:hypothetical protein